MDFDAIKIQFNTAGLCAYIKDGAYGLVWCQAVGLDKIVFYSYNNSMNKQSLPKAIAEYAVYGDPNRVLTNVGMLPVDMVGPGHRIGAKLFKTESGARRAAAQFVGVLKTRVERIGRP